jgi:phasin family protein
MKMQNEMFEKLTSTGESSYAAVRELGVINNNLLKQMTELQFSFATMSIEYGVEQAKVLSSTTNYKDLLSVQADFASDYSNKVIDYSRQTADVIAEARNDVVALFEKSVKSVTETNKPATKRTTKKATS